MARTASTVEYLPVEEMEKAPRGRKPNLNQELVDVLAGLPEGQFVKLDTFFGEVADENGERSSVNNKIRTHWKAAFGNDSRPSIHYSRAGVPQVQHSQR